jgi:putative endonuclease
MRVLSQRAVAQPGRALGSGPRGRRFKSSQPDSFRSRPSLFRHSSRARRMADAYLVYVLRSAKTGRRYVGSCQELTLRLRQHNAGESKSTKHGIPWRLIHWELFSTRSEAMRREKYLNTGKGRDELDQIELASMEFTAMDWLERSPRRQAGGSNPLSPTRFADCRVDVVTRRGATHGRCVSLFKTTDDH